MQTTVSRKYFFIILLTSFLLVVSFSSGFGKNSVQGKIVLTADIASSEGRKVFSPYDTIYAFITLPGIEPGNYIADISWANASGSINQYKPASVTIVPGKPPTFYSWFRLLRNGPLTGSLTGKDFNADSRGKWILTVAIAGVFLQTTEFEIQ